MIKKDDNIILIIGNGPSILKYNFGRMIENFKNVGRINNFKIKNYSNNIGSNTSIWFNGGNQNLIIPKIIPEKIIVFVPYDLQKKDFNKIVKRTTKRLKVGDKEYTLIKKSEMLKYEKITNIKRPTTGLNSILWSMQKYKTVLIHGFDFFEKNNDHYYDSFFIKKIANLKRFLKVDKHDHIAEKKFVTKLIKDKKIFTLKEYLK